MNHDEEHDDIVTRLTATAQKAQTRHMEYPQYAAAWKSSTIR